MNTQTLQTGNETTVRRPRRAVATVLAGGVFAAAAGIVGASSAAAAGVGTAVDSFFDVGAHTWTVPAGVHSATFRLVGADGGAGDGELQPAHGGKGAILTATLAVTPGDTYTITLGGQGASGANGGAGGFNGGGAGAPGWRTDYGTGHGGGGGGATDVRHGGTALSDRILIAGGGGGDGGPGNPVDIHRPSAGGYGGGVTGASNGYRDPGAGGFGWRATATAGGAGGLFQYGTTSSHDGTDGGLASGGNGGAGGPGAGGGGGGGGLYGGGGGAGTDDINVPASGGGGGSGYAIASATDVTLSYPPIGFDGSAAISYQIPYAPSFGGTPPLALLNGPFSYQYAVDGLPAPTLSAQGLPPGLTLNQSGLLSGTPTVAGNYSIAITATNDIGSSTFTSQISVYDPTQLFIVQQPPTVAGTPGTAQLGQEYSYTFQTTGSPLPQCSAPSSDLPPGLTLDGTSCTLSGTPTQTGGYTFTVTADNGSSSGSATFTLRVGEPATITGTPPASVSTSDAVNFAYTVGGSPQPQTSVSSGSLPPGLQLADGTLSGTPTTPGTYTWTVTAHNGIGDDASVTSTVVVTTPPAPAVVTPNVSVVGASVAEGNSGTRTVTLRVTLDTPSTQQVTVRWNTVSGTAKAGSDFLAAYGTVTFRPGQTVKTITVRVKGDRVKERNESFTVRLHDPVHATISQGTATVSIRNDD